MVEAIRKIFISAFFLFHIAAVTFWVLSPYSDMALNAPKPTNILRSGERLFFSGLERIKPLPISTGLFNYIDTIGAHQYWDFFAPEIPKTHRYLRVCGGIHRNPATDWIDCSDLLYKSFDGTIDDAARAFNGKRSRSYRLTENLLRFNREDLFESFTAYWLTTNTLGKTLNHAYLVETEIRVEPFVSQSTRANRRDNVLWITSR